MRYPRPPRKAPENKEEILPYLNELQQFTMLLAEFFNLASIMVGKKGDIGINKIPSSPVDVKLPTKDVEVVDSGSAGSTQQGWIEVKIGGVTGYLRVFVTK